MGMSLYADLLGEKQKADQGATISGAPVRYDAKKADADELDAISQQKKKDGTVT